MRANKDRMFEDVDRKLGNAIWFFSGMLVGTLITAFIIVPLG